MPRVNVVPVAGRTVELLQYRIQCHSAERRVEQLRTLLSIPRVPMLGVKTLYTELIEKTRVSVMPCSGFVRKSVLGHYRPLRLRHHRDCRYAPSNRAVELRMSYWRVIMDSDSPFTKLLRVERLCHRTSGTLPPIYDPAVCHSTSMAERTATSQLSAGS